MVGRLVVWSLIDVKSRNTLDTGNYGTREGEGAV